MLIVVVIVGVGFVSDCIFDDMRVVVLGEVELVEFFFVCYRFGY